MPGTHKKGTNDADSNGKKGGSLPEAKVAGGVIAEPVAETEPEAKPAKARDFGKEIDAIKATMQRNGWSV